MSTGKYKNFTIFLTIPFLHVQDLEEKIQNYLPHKELLETVQRLAVRHIFLPSSSDKKNVFFLLSTCEYSKLEEPNVDNVSVDSLISLEEQLETALSVSRARKVYVLLLSDSTNYSTKPSF